MAQSRLSEIKSELKNDRKKLKTLANALTQSQEISVKIGETTSKTEKCLKSFERELEPLFLQSSNLRRTIQITEEAVKRANSNIDYIQNAKELESILRTKAKGEELDQYIECIERANTIKKFTEGDSSNEFYQETSQRINAALDLAEDNLTELFTDLLRQLSLHSEMSDIEQTIEKLRKIHAYETKIGNYQHFSVYLISREKRFGEEMDSLKARIKNTSSFKQHTKDDHPLIEGFEELKNSFETEKRLAEELFDESSDAVYSKVSEGHVKAFISLIETFESTTKSLEKKVLFLIVLDFLDHFQTDKEELEGLITENNYEMLAKKAVKLAENTRQFLKSYQKEIFENPQKPINEKIADTTISVVKFWHEMKLYKEGVAFISKIQSVADSTMRTLLENLEAKKKSLKTKNPVLPNLFMLNNIFFIMKKTETLGLQDNFSAGDVKELERYFNRELSEYISSIWEKVVNVDIKIDEPKDNLKKATKEAIKKFFNDFNHACADFQKSHKEIWLSDEELAVKLQKLLTDKVLKKYLSVCSTVSEIDYSKDKSKYQKLEPSEVKKIFEALLKA